MRSGFVMLKPKAGCNADAMARSIASFSFVRKVFLTTGDYGFVVSVDADGNIEKAIRKIGKVSVGAAMSAAIGHSCYSGRGRRIRRHGALLL
ncbi:MAG: hypothetical protein KGH61_01515 [Candidatus Micrarchaeota archaeon]|nr:hypothetical protein [Candidatus Micrarchaeota archaeon]MDE1847609.1 hypothetical protein [Candidatus Micrarchaeota archaeon]MDE1863812.1 hypothetical protein [Candidatus Micrarchaeota archaeon]